tara:strand:- start:1278 stop:2774 length:1497 start_codon:yes stop_codon:yes gene_type:complete
MRIKNSILLILMFTLTILVTKSNSKVFDVEIPLSRKQIISLEEGNPIYKIHGIQTTFNGVNVLIKNFKNGLIVESKKPIFKEFRKIMLIHNLQEKDIILNNRNQMKFENILVKFNNYDEKKYLVVPRFNQENIELMKERYLDPVLNVNEENIIKQSFNNLNFINNDGDALIVEDYYYLKDALTGKYSIYPNFFSRILSIESHITQVPEKIPPISEKISSLKINNNLQENEYNDLRIDLISKTIKLKNNSSLIFKNSTVNFKDIKIISEGINSIIFYDCPEVYFENVEITGIDNYVTNEINLPSGLTFVNSNVEIKNSKFHENTSGDDFINFYSSSFLISKSVFQNILYDAVDSDFSDGIIENSEFNKIGNDGIDASGSKIRVIANTFNYVLDKALSIGEISSLESSSNYFMNSSIGIVVKDGSTLSSDNESFQNNIIDYSAFMKKNFYAYPKLQVSNISKFKYLIEPEIIVEGDVNIKRTKNVESLMYGNFFGRKSER